MSAEKIGKEALYERAVEIASECFVAAEYCVRENKSKCNRKEKNCAKCIKSWFVHQAANEISSACRKEAWGAKTWQKA